MLPFLSLRVCCDKMLNLPSSSDLLSAAVMMGEKRGRENRGKVLNFVLPHPSGNDLMPEG